MNILWIWQRSFINHQVLGTQICVVIQLGLQRLDTVRVTYVENACIRTCTLYPSGSAKVLGKEGWELGGGGIGVWDKFHSRGAEVISARIFCPLLARKSSGFALILPEFLPENGYLKNCRGGGGCSPPQPHGPYAYRGGGGQGRCGVWKYGTMFVLQNLHQISDVNLLLNKELESLIKSRVLSMP